MDIAGQQTPCLVPADKPNQIYDNLKIMFDWPDERLTFRERDELIANNAWRINKTIKDENSEIEYTIPQRKMQHHLFYNRLP